MKLTTKGQVTIPQSIRERLGLLPWTEVEFDVVGNSVRIRKKATTSGRGKRVIDAMRRAPRPRMGQGGQSGKTGKTGMTTDELMAFTRGE